MTQIVDYFNFLPPLYRALPEGQPFTRGPLRYPTLRQSNLSPRIKRFCRKQQSVSDIQVIPGYHYNLE